jgi:NADH-quinone oxidoreductase subunit J
MGIVFYISGIIALIATLMVVTRLNAAHAAIYLVVSLLAIAMTFYSLGAPFAAAMEIIVYAGAIIVLFIFVIMMLNLGPKAAKQESEWLNIRSWIGPAALALILGGELGYLVLSGENHLMAIQTVDAKTVALTLFGPYLLGVELASFLLLAGLVGAYHLGYRSARDEGEVG